MFYKYLIHFIKSVFIFHIYKFLHVGQNLYSNTYFGLSQKKMFYREIVYIER